MVGEEREKEEKGFTVRDKRHFFQQEEERASTEEEKGEKPEAGEARARGEGIQVETEKKEEVRKEKREERKKEGKEEQQEQIPLPEANFSNFVHQLTLQALIQLGEIQDPLSKETRKSLPLAKHTIDHIAMLKDKTHGNLTQDEQALIDSALYDLRMRYVKTSS